MRDWLEVAERYAKRATEAEKRVAELETIARLSLPLCSVTMIKPTEYIGDVVGCSGCGQTHRELIFRELDPQILVEENFYSRWSICPTNLVLLLSRDDNHG